MGLLGNTCKESKNTKYFFLKEAECLAVCVIVLKDFKERVIRPPKMNLP